MTCQLSLGEQAGLQVMDHIALELPGDIYTGRPQNNQGQQQIGNGQPPLKPAAQEIHDISPHLYLT